MRRAAGGIGRFLDMGWGAFVLTFLYFVGVTALILGGADFAAPVMVVLYLLPPVVYAASLLRRAAQRILRLVPRGFRAARAA